MSQEETATHTTPGDRSSVGPAASPDFLLAGADPAEREKPVSDVDELKIPRRGAGAEAGRYRPSSMRIRTHG